MMRQLIVWVSLWCQETHDKIMKLLLLILHVTLLGFMSSSSIFWIRVCCNMFSFILFRFIGLITDYRFSSFRSFFKLGDQTK